MAKEASTEANMLLPMEQPDKEEETTTLAASWSPCQKVAAAMAVVAFGFILAAGAFYSGRDGTQANEPVPLRGLQQGGCFCECGWVTKEACPKDGAGVPNCCFKTCCDKLWAPAGETEEEHDRTEQQRNTTEGSAEQLVVEQDMHDEVESSLDMDEPRNHTAPSELNVNESGRSSWSNAHAFWQYLSR